MTLHDIDELRLFIMTALLGMEVLALVFIGDCF